MSGRKAAVMTKERREKEINNLVASKAAPQELMDKSKGVIGVIQSPLG